MFLIYDFVVTRSSSSTSVRHVFFGAGLGTTAQEELAAQQDKALQPRRQAPRRTSPRKGVLPKKQNMLRNGSQRAAQNKNGTRQAGRRTRTKS